MRRTKLVLDIENTELLGEVESLITKIDYPLKFDNICISESCKIDFLKGDAKENLEIVINPRSDSLKNKRLFRGYFARMIFLLINEKEGLNKSIKDEVGCPKVVPRLQNFFADYKAAKYGFLKVMKRFFVERITEKVYSKNPVSNEDFVEFYLYYLALKKLREGEEISSLIMPLKPVGSDPLLAELEKLSYPFKVGDRKLAKIWDEFLGEERIDDAELR